ncbi:MAG: hypothetical protein HYT69_00600 [Candidatus Zambryskibacteria bacterium]|nr:hypothetical protein [Candidatus Zambryskibacteria bacterium]
MQRIIAVATALLVVAIFFSKSLLPLGLELRLPSFQTFQESTEAGEAWTVFEKYLEFAKSHDLEGIKSLSHQISDTCNNPARETECFALMDSVYAIASPLKSSDFKHIVSDEHQIVMYTDGPTVAVLYFTRDKIGALKVLGLSLCFEDETSVGSCIKTDSIKQDRDSDGWWDSVEALFYENKTN